LSSEEKKRTSINRSSEYEVVFETLVSLSGDKVFNYMYELICFAAYVGVANDRRIKIESKHKQEPVAISLFESNNLSRHFWTINMFAYGDVAKLVNHNECIETFEEYSNGGMEIIMNRLSEKSGDSSGVETLMTMLQKVNASYQKKSGKQVRKITF
jgi:dnd system-associated protein 4